MTIADVLFVLLILSGCVFAQVYLYDRISKLQEQEDNN